MTEVERIGDQLRRSLEGDAWDRAVATLVDSEKLLRDAILGLDDSRLEDRPRTKTVYELLHGVVQHNLYHAGQMALLKRAQREE